MKQLRYIARLLVGASALSLGVTSVTAQQSAADEDDGTIIVTAQKREQSLQETPIAITAISSEAIELQNITQTTDLASIAPNISVNGGVTNLASAVVTIRGIPTPADEAMGFDSPIGIYLDGVYLARQSAATFEIADIERIEILRGPQGTLFGRNTTGGAVNYITKSPTEDSEVRVKGGYGSYNYRIARAVVNTGNLGGFRLSASGLYKARNGIVDNRLEPRKSLDPGAYSTVGARFALEADLADNLLLTNIFDWTRTRGVAYANQLTAVGDGTFRANRTIGGNEFSQVQPANVRGYLEASTIVQTECGAPLDSVQIARLDPICLDRVSRTTDNIWGNLTRLELDLESFVVRSSTAYRRWSNDISGSDLDGLGTVRGAVFNQASTFNGFPVGLLQFIPTIPEAARGFISAAPVPSGDQSLFYAPNDRSQEQFSQELEIIGGFGTSFEWVFGGFYFSENGQETNPQNGAFALDTNQLVFTDALWGPLGAQFRAANPARFRASPFSSTLAYSVRAQSFALYGQATWRPSGPDGALGITVGMRYTWDKKSIVRTQNGMAAYTDAADIALNTQESRFSEPTGHVTVDYRASEEVNLYAKYARGYRSGGFNARQATQADDPETASVDESVPLIPFGEEKIDSYEIGAKMVLGRGVFINAAAFYNVYKDLQATVPVPIEGGGSFGTQVINAGKIDYAGFEIEAKMSLSEALSIDGGFGYVSRSVKNFPAADVNGDIQNIAEIVRPGNAPSTTAQAAVTYSQYIGSGDTRLTARFGWNYTSAQTFFPNPLTAPFLEETSAGKRSLFNAQLRMDGLKLGEGPEFSITVWGKNIFNNHYISRGIDFGQFGFGSVIYGDPATFGVDVEFAF